MPDNQLAVRIFSTTVLTAVPNSDIFPKESEESVCIARFYAGSKRVGSRGSLAALVFWHSIQERAGRIKMRVLGPLERSAAYRLACTLIGELRALYPGAEAYYAAHGTSNAIHGLGFKVVGV